MKVPTFMPMESPKERIRNMEQKKILETIP
jgi:hypothetical protein